MKTPPPSLVAAIAAALMVAGCGDDRQATSRPADTRETSTGQAKPRGTETEEKPRSGSGPGY